MSKVTLWRPQAVIHVDLDGASAIYRVHGWPLPAGRDMLFVSGLTNMLRFLDDIGVRATLFAIGEDLDDPEKRALLAEAVSRGHEVASHSLTHRRLASLDSATKRREIGESRLRLADALGVAVDGFRAPAFSVDREVLGLVAEAGYVYDSSLFPSHPLLSSRAGRQGRDAGDDSRPVMPSVPAGPDNGLLELPLPAYAPLPFPFHPCYSLVLGTWYFRLGLRRFRRTGLPLVLLFHLTDLADPLPPAQLPNQQARFFTLSYLDGAEKRRRCEAMVRSVRRAYEFVDTRSLLAGSREGLAGSSPYTMVIQVRISGLPVISDQ